MSDRTVDTFQEQAALHVYESGDGYSVVASSVAEAVETLEEEWSVEANADEIRLLPDDELITICVDADGNLCPCDDSDDEVTMTAAAWCAKEGAGKLCREE